MTPFLVATLLALLIVGALALVHRRGDVRRLRQALAAAATALLLAIAYVVWVAGGKLDRIAADQVALGNLQMVEAAGSFRLEGRITNRSSTDTLASVPVRLVVENCVATDCRTVYDGEFEILLTVRPGETHDFRHVYTPSGPVPPAPAAPGARRWRAEADAPRAFRAPVR